MKTLTALCLLIVTSNALAQQPEKLLVPPRPLDEKPKKYEPPTITMPKPFEPPPNKIVETKLGFGHVRLRVHTANDTPLDLEAPENVALLEAWVAKRYPGAEPFQWINAEGRILGVVIKTKSQLYVTEQRNHPPPK